MSTSLPCWNSEETMFFESMHFKIYKKYKSFVSLLVCRSWCEEINYMRFVSNLYIKKPSIRRIGLNSNSEICTDRNCLLKPKLLLHNRRDKDGDKIILCFAHCLFYIFNMFVFFSRYSYKHYSLRGMSNK